MLGQGVISPVLPLYAESFGVGLAAIGVALSAFALARVVLNTPLGLLADRRGRRPLLVFGPVLVSAGMLGSALAPSLLVLSLWRLVAGAGSAMYMTGAMIYIADIAAPDQRARYIGTNQAALGLGVAIGPAVGGFLADRYGLRAPFYLVAVSALVAGLYAALRLSETRPNHLAVSGRKRTEWRGLLRSKAFLAVAVVAMATFFTRGAARLTLIPLMGSRELDLSAGDIGLVLSAVAVANLVLVTPAGYLADRWGTRVAVIPSMWTTALALVLFAFADSLTPFLLAAGFLAISSAVTGPAPAAFVADASPDEARGMAFGFYRTAGDLGLLIGPPLVGLVADASGFGAAFIVNAVVVAAAVVVFAIWGRVEPKQSPN